MYTYESLRDSTLGILKRYKVFVISIKHNFSTTLFSLWGKISNLWNAFCSWNDQKYLTGADTRFSPRGEGGGVSWDCSPKILNPLIFQGVPDSYEAFWSNIRGFRVGSVPRGSWMGPNLSEYLMRYRGVPWAPPLPLVARATTHIRQCCSEYLIYYETWNHHLSKCVK